jgi:hypothetical protein
VRSVLHSLHLLCRRALDAAYANYKAAIEEGEPPAQVISNIQEALAHAAALSRFFWPVRVNSLRKARAQRLRTAFKIGNDSALFSRSLRDA